MTTPVYTGTNGFCKEPDYQQESMLNNTLNTNEVKDRSGVEIEFSRIKTLDRTTEFSKIAEQPNLPVRLKVSHQETGAGITLRRRSVIRFDKSSISTVDATKVVTNSCYIVLDAAVGGITSNNELADVIAMVLSFVGTTGAATTVLFDGTGNGAKALIEGGL